MLKILFRRILQAIPVLFVVVTVTFFMVRAAPGGPFDDERAVPPEVLKNLNERYHLDDPLWKQYVDYLGQVIQGDFGPSFKFPSRTVNEMIASGFPVTIAINIA